MQRTKSFRSLFSARILCLIAVIGVSGCSYSEKAIIAQIEELGGKYRVNADGSGEPLKIVTFQRAGISDDDLECLEDIANLHTLNLSGTKVSDRGLDHLKGLSTLKRLILTSTKISEAGVAELKEALPDCKIDH